MRKSPVIKREPFLPKSEQRASVWKRIVEKEFGMVNSNHYRRDFKTPESLRAHLAEIKKKHPAGVITLASFEEKYGLPEGCLDRARYKGILPDPAIQRTAITAYDFKQLFDLIHNPDFQSKLFNAQKTKNPRLNKSGRDDTAKQIHDSLEIHGFLQH